jgi:hypothetical protein
MRRRACRIDSISGLVSEYLVRGSVAAAVVALVPGGLPGKVVWGWLGLVVS